MQQRRKQRARVAEKALRTGPDRGPQYAMLALIVLAAVLTAAGIT